MANVLNKFYVYEHWRPDKDICFWVGKGHGNRAHNFRRNFHYNNIVKALCRLGMCVEVRLVQSGLEEVAAFNLEKERIAFWRSLNVQLANYTDGGDGVSGLKHSEETKAKIRVKRASQQISHSDETKKKIGSANKIALKGRKNPEHGEKMRGRKHTDQHREKIRAALVGRPVSEETREKMRKSNLGQKRSPETRERLRQSHLGKKQSAETVAKRSIALRRHWMSQDARDKHSEVVRKSYTDEVRQRMSELAKERFSSTESRKKLSDAAKKRWAKQKATSP